MTKKKEEPVEAPVKKPVTKKAVTEKPSYAEQLAAIIAKRKPE